MKALLPITFFCIEHSLWKRALDESIFHFHLRSICQDKTFLYHVPGLQKCSSSRLSHYWTFSWGSHCWIYRWKADWFGARKTRKNNRLGSCPTFVPRHARICTFGPWRCWVCWCYPYWCQKYPSGRLVVKHTLNSLFSCLFTWKVCQNARLHNYE